jgi:type IV pilus assembly protein PilQ
MSILYPFRGRALWSLAWCTLAFVFIGGAPLSVYAQQEPSQRELRTFIPPEQLVSFLPTTPFDQFIEFLNPIFSNVTGKQIIDPDSRTEPIGVSVTRMQFFDAFELVLQAKGLSFRESERYFIVQDAPDEPDLSAREGATQVSAGPVKTSPASLETPEIKISALLFEVNLSRVRELGLDWSIFLAPQNQGGQQGGGGGGSGGQDENRPRFKLKPKSLGGRVGDFFRSDEISAPDEIDFGDLARFFRALEDDGLGQTLAQPSVSVQSEEQGRIQIGSDIPIQVRDFAGNTITQFISTGIIVDVVPTLISEPLADTSGSPMLDFVHLDVKVERSSGRPFGGSVAIDRNEAQTQVLLLDEEQTVIGGLYSTDFTTSRRGIPILKDLPPWFFGLKYVFGREVKTIARRELVIVLQAQVIDPVTTRAEKDPSKNLLEQRRREVEERIKNFSPQVHDKYGPSEVLPSMQDDGGNN